MKDGTDGQIGQIARLEKLRADYPIGVRADWSRLRLREIREMQQVAMLTSEACGNRQ